MKTSRQIIICGVCNGSGMINCKELTNPHKNEYKKWTENCSNCGGTGKVVEVVTIQHEPFIPPEPVPRK